MFGKHCFNLKHIYLLITPQVDMLYLSRLSHFAFEMTQNRTCALYLFFTLPVFHTFPHCTRWLYSTSKAFVFAQIVLFLSAHTRFLVVQSVKRWSAILAISDSIPAEGGTLSNVNGVSLHTNSIIILPSCRCDWVTVKTALHRKSSIYSVHVLMTRKGESVNGFR